ncbi:MAG: hypothetical protein QM647_18380 [Asticcacaulis sp.]|uniref:hypothetical protein n=1 Tax=Asticcacaulis sp. TaxID=1872648 RepID=UPI0039E69250
MSIRLYDSAWVAVRGVDTPQQVSKDRTNPSAFLINGYKYDIDGRAFLNTDAGPDILHLLSLQDARTLGLSTQYSAPKSLLI